MIPASGVRRLLWIVSEMEPRERIFPAMVQKVVKGDYSPGAFEWASKLRPLSNYHDAKDCEGVSRELCSISLDEIRLLFRQSTPLASVIDAVK